MNINFSKFHKIECDDNCTTLKHPSGHTIKISHKSLTPENKKELDKLPMKMAKGGGVHQYNPNAKGSAGTAYAQKQASKASKPSEPSKPIQSPSGVPPRNAIRTYTEPDDAGPDVVLAAIRKEAPPFGPKGTEPKQHYPPCINPSCKSYGHSHPNCRCYGGAHGSSAEEGFFAEGGDVKGFCSEDRPHQKECEYFKDGGESGDQLSSEQPLSVNLGPQDMPEQQQEIKEPYMHDFVAGDQQQSDVPIGTPEGQSQPQQAQDKAAQFQQSKQQHLQELGQEAQMFQSDLDAGHIKPETYQELFNKRSTLGKIGTMFGLLMSGAGSGLSGQPNALMSMMNSEIQNDLDAQQKSVGNQQNFLKINQQNILNKAQAKNMTADANTKAYALAKVQMNYAALHKLVSDTMKLPPGPQRDQQLQTLAMMNQSVQNDNFNVLDRAATGAAFYQTMFGNEGGGGAPEQQFQKKVQRMKALGPQSEKIATDLEEKHYPGIPGQASMPLSGDDRVQIHSGMAFDRSLNNFRNWAKTHSGDLSPSDMNYGHALAADLQGAYRQATHGGVYKEGEQNFISGIIDETPTKFFNSVRVLPKLDAASDANKQRLDQLLKDKGFQGYPGQQSGQDSQLKTMHGSQYKKTNGGWQKVQ